MSLQHLELEWSNAVTPITRGLTTRIVVKAEPGAACRISEQTLPNGSEAISYADGNGDVAVEMTVSSEAIEDIQLTFEWVSSSSPVGRTLKLRPNDRTRRSGHGAEPPSRRIPPGAMSIIGLTENELLGLSEDELIDRHLPSRPDPSRVQLGTAVSQTEVA
jgi:hypothetical protein